MGSEGLELGADSVIVVSPQEWVAERGLVQLALNASGRGTAQTSTIANVMVLPIFLISIASCTPNMQKAETKAFNTKRVQAQRLLMPTLLEFREKTGSFQLWRPSFKSHNRGPNSEGPPQQQQPIAVCKKAPNVQDIPRAIKACQSCCIDHGAQYHHHRHQVRTKQSPDNP